MTTIVDNTTTASTASTANTKLNPRAKDFVFPSILLTQSAVAQSSLITIWVLLEGKSNAVKFIVEPNDFPSQSPDLDDFKHLLIKRFKILLHVEPVDLELYDFKDCSRTLLSDTSLARLKTSAESPLLVRYPLSSASINVTFKFLHNLGEYRMPHYSNSWALLREAATTKFEHLTTSDFYFVVQNDSAEEIENEFQFNNLMSRIPRNYLDECILNLKVQIKGKKTYGDWKIKEVFEDVLHQDFISLNTTPTFNLDYLPALDNPLPREELEFFAKKLEEKLYAFNKEININEATMHEYVSIFMTTAVRNLQLHSFNSARLSVKLDLDGSRSYGPVDYTVDVDGSMVLVVKTKTEDTDKEVAQNIMQMHIAIEKLINKRKLTQKDPYQSSLSMFGIVTTGYSWRFIRWTGTLETPKVQISGEYVCDFTGDMQSAKKMLSYIVRVLQLQAGALRDDKPPVYKSILDYV
ncbi:6122_t:CDS:2 [Ambispora gerdemannii]|uniref:6122_t:CDS:1 n=1 Tax=Ambispora gerdemannii TaxID=144530 RepID=A0A9N9G605_9GLOM|nr:6122_t:CDS:2 [Ambispora gerdemannii]